MAKIETKKVNEEPSSILSRCLKMTRQCCECRQIKPLIDFNVGSVKCLKCRSEHIRYLETYGKKRHKQTSREYNLFHNYNLTEYELREKAKTQNNKCYICDRTFCDVEHGIQIDHDHKNGKVRGLLCLNCNVGLGMFGDNAAILRKAADYLDEWSFDED